jgi:hypothetical protein
MSGTAKLVDRKVVPCGVREYAATIESMRRVALDSIEDVDVSTVFLGLDHGFGGKPLWFETMIVGGPLDDSQERYTTIEEAEAGHARWVALVRGEHKP